MKLSIILLNYKRKELTLSCVASVFNQYQKQLDKGEFEIIVVDNLSQDNSLEFLRRAFAKNKYKSIYLIPNSENSGFGRGCNFGASYAKGEFLLFLNNDTQVLDTGLLSMVDFLDSRPQVGVVGGRMENEDRTQQASAGSFYTFFNAILMIFGMQRFGMVYSSPKNIQKTDWVSGSSLMIRRSLFEKISGFDKEIFMYMEDVDICYRVKKAGMLVYYYPNVTIIHMGQGSTNRKFAVVNIYKGLMYFYKKHMPQWQTKVIELLLRFKAIVLIRLGKAIHNNYLLTTYEEALKAIR